MSNVERLRIEQETVHLLLNKLQRHRGDTLNSRTCPLTNYDLVKQRIDKSIATVTAQITSPQEGIIGVKLVHW